MLGDGCIKRDYDFELKIFHHCIFVSEIQKKFCNALSWCTLQVLNHSKLTKNEENMRMELKRGSRAKFFKKFGIKTITHPLPVLLLYF
jgi:hypothetical protein